MDCIEFRRFKTLNDYQTKVLIQLYKKFSRLRISGKDFSIVSSAIINLKKLMKKNLIESMSQVNDSLKNQIIYVMLKNLKKVTKIKNRLGLTLN